MIDFKQWIYSQDMAAWFSQKDSFSVGAQMDCICCAPHRTIGEKLDGLRRLYDESGEEIVLDRIKSLESLQCQNRQEVPEEARLFQAEVFCQGEQEPGLPMIFQTAGQAADEIKLRIEELSAQCELEREQYYGIIKVCHKTDSADRFLHEENLVTRHDGEVLFVLYPDFECGAKDGPFIGSEEIAWKIPYASGTIVEVEKNPFFPSTKGVLLNIAEPGEAGFVDDRYNQWLLCAEPTYTEQTHGINVINLLDEYVPFSCNAELELPYKQYISAYKGKLKDTEMWLAELSELIRWDKSCIKTILRDRKPNLLRRMEQDKKRLAYVRGLAAQKTDNGLKI